MAPPTVADIGRGGGELRLECERFPGDHRVAGEADRVAVRAGAGIAREGERPASVASGIKVVHVVEDPQRVESGLAGHATLLPVEPPEVNAFGLQIVVHGEIGVHIVRVGQVEFEVLTACRIDAHAPGGLRVGAFECADAVAWMHVERGLEALAVQLVEECHMVGEQVAVPRIAGPSGTVLRVDAVHEMPVHVDHGRGERNALTLEAVHKRQVFGLRVPVVAAPPIAECETRQQRLRAGEPVEVLHGFDVAVRIAEEVQVDAPLVAR